MAADKVFDVVIVGAGPAGCVLASRLSEDPDRTVALIEAGPDYGADRSAWPTDLRDPWQIWPDSHNWGFAHANRPADRPSPLARGKVVGGSSTINGCMWFRGSAADYDQWADLGNPGWAWSNLLPYFRKIESDPTGGEMHGVGGPVPIHRVDMTNLSALDTAFLATADELGYDYVPDANGSPEQLPGISPATKNIAGGERINAAFTYLAMARGRANLTIFPDMHIDRVLFENGAAAGLIAANGEVFRGRGVILAAGSFCSPAILMRSGIGPSSDLQALGIPVVADRPGVSTGSTSSIIPTSTKPSCASSRSSRNSPHRSRVTCHLSSRAGPIAPIATLTITCISARYSMRTATPGPSGCPQCCSGPLLAVRSASPRPIPSPRLRSTTTG